MMSLEAIRQMSAEAAERAAEENQTPYVYFSLDEIGNRAYRDAPAFPFPFLGDYVPDGWETDGESYFVDSSGLGADDEPALSVGRFAQEVLARETAARADGVSLGWAVVEAGQFQVYVQCYRKTEEEK